MSALLQAMLPRKTWRGLLRGAVSLLIIVGLVVGGYSLYARFSVPRVTMSKSVVGPVVQAFYATGTLSAYREYPVKANVEGILDEVLVDKGTVVKKGQKLAHVYVEEFLLKRRQAEADLDLKRKMGDEQNSPILQEFDAKIRAAEEQLLVARREYNRLVQLRDTGGRTLSEIDRADEAVKTLVNSIEALKAGKNTKRLEYERDIKTAAATLEIAQWNLDQQSIVSPIDGVVLDWPSTVGTRVRVNDLVMNVADVRADQLILRVNVDEEDKTRVLLDQTVHASLYSYPQRVFEGRVARIYPKADPTRRTFEVDVRVLQPDPAFAAGMTGELAFIVAEKEEAIVVPTQAIQRGKIWQVRKGRLVSRDVKTGLASVQRTEITEGLTEDEDVLVSPLGNMNEGDEVLTKFLDPKIAAGLNEPKKESSSFSKF